MGISGCRKNVPILFFSARESRALSLDRQGSFDVGVGGKHERMIVRQFDDRCEDLIRPPSRSNSTVDESSEFQMERVLASEEAIRIVVWHIGRVYFVHLMNLSRSKKRVKRPARRGESAAAMPCTMAEASAGSSFYRRRMVLRGPR